MCRVFRLAGLAIALQAPPSFAQALPDHIVNPVEIERRQTQAIDAQEARALKRPDVLTPDAAPDLSAPLTFEPESPCFDISRVVWEADKPTATIQRLASAAVGKCVGATGLRTLQSHLVAQLLDRGLMTARVLVPEQSLAQGTITLRYVPGRISAVQSPDGVGWWRTALPTGPDGSLNQRDLDQALENIRRLGSQADARIDVMPGPTPGDSDVVIRPGSGKRWHGYIGGDDAGMDAIGKYQVNAGLTLDSPLFLYDQISVAWNSNAHWRRAGANSRATSVNYTLPFGYWSLFMGASKSTYRQSVAGFDAPIIYGGTTKQIQAGVSVTPYRAARYKGNVTATLLRKRVSSTLNDVDIDVQRRDAIGYSLNVGHRHYVGPSVLDVGVGVRGTFAGLSDRPGFVYDKPDWSGRSTILMASAGVYVPFQVAQLRLAYQANAQIQHAKTALLPSDYFTIGNRYAVRGFDGQVTLASENGWTLRNDIALNLESIGIPNQQWYAGLDVGRVSGESARFLTGQTLVGAVTGLRGAVSVPYLQASYDLSIGWPLKKPDTLRTASTVVAASLMVTF